MAPAASRPGSTPCPGGRCQTHSPAPHPRSRPPEHSPDRLAPSALQGRAQRVHDEYQQVSRDCSDAHTSWCRAFETLSAGIFSSRQTVWPPGFCVQQAHYCDAEPPQQAAPVAQRLCHEQLNEPHRQHPGTSPKNADTFGVRHQRQHEYSCLGRAFHVPDAQGPGCKKGCQYCCRQRAIGYAKLVIFCSFWCTPGAAASAAAGAEMGAGRLPSGTRLALASSSTCRSENVLHLGRLLVFIRNVAAGAQAGAALHSLVCFTQVQAQQKPPQMHQSKANCISDTTDILRQRPFSSSPLTCQSWCSQDASNRAFGSTSVSISLSGAYQATLALLKDCWRYKQCVVRTTQLSRAHFLFSASAGKFGRRRRRPQGKYYNNGALRHPCYEHQKLGKQHASAAHLLFPASAGGIRAAAASASAPAGHVSWPLYCFSHVLTPVI